MPEQGRVAVAHGCRADQSGVAGALRQQAPVHNSSPPNCLAAPTIFDSGVAAPVGMSRASRPTVRGACWHDRGRRLRHVASCRSKYRIAAHRPEVGSGADSGLFAGAGTREF
ncbi:MAG: hypothetical protein MZV70_63470 [Desulfobacterales bacterium]|nr:hypothetical protein [Desulfobacterales bacterium]